MVNYWLEMGVDGFRCDVIHSISKDFSAPEGGGIGPHLHEYLHELHTRAFGPHGALTIGETWNLTAAQMLELTGRTRGELTAAFQFEHLMLGRENGDKFRRSAFDRAAFTDILARWDKALRDDGCPVLVLENHDQPRALSRFGDSRYPRESATMLAALVYGMRGIAVVYQGQELGLENPVFPALDAYRDIETIHAAQALAGTLDETALLDALNFGSRDNARVPMPWSGAPNGGFTTGTPWISASFDPQRTVAAEEADPDSVLQFYRRLLRLRQADAVLRRGDFTLLLNEGGTVVYRRSLGADVRLVVARFSDAEAPLPEIVPPEAECLLCNYPDPGAALRPYEARILKV